ncbi:hypothetical protein BX666DRAFT_1349732 [Dichotomocladium elegans]|nr:hypothetical protein BX666DRAFT_1349732 [Dichotomocladium elegans]
MVASLPPPQPQDTPMLNNTAPTCPKDKSSAFSAAKLPPSASSAAPPATQLADIDSAPSSLLPLDRLFCKGCKSLKPLRLFAGRKRCFKTCEICRRRQTKHHGSDGQEREMDAITLDELTKVLECCAPGESCHYRFRGNILIDNKLAQLNNEAIATALVSAVGQCDGYLFYMKRLTDPVLKMAPSFNAICSQSCSAQQQVPDEGRKRKCSRMETFECRGRIAGSIDRAAGIVRLSIDHAIAHPPPETLDEQSKSRVAKRGCCRVRD